MIYTVQAFRKGNRTFQSKLLGATHSRELAVALAEAEEGRTEHKWLCEVLGFDEQIAPQVVRPLDRRMA